jgi:hypothetical protein
LDLLFFLDLWWRLFDFPPPRKLDGKLDERLTKELSAEDVISLIFPVRDILVP